MAIDLDDREPDADAESTPAQSAFSIRSAVPALRAAAGRWLPTLGLHIFLIILPLIIVFYPAYLVAARLADYQKATTIEATFIRVTIEDVRPSDRSASLLGSNRHFNIEFTFDAGHGKTYLSTQQKSWPAPGLRKDLEAQYAAGDRHTLYLLPDKKTVMEEVVAKDAFLRHTGLMAILLCATLLYYLLKSRLASRWPSQLPTPSRAMAKSVLLGQTIALLIASMFIAIVEISPILVPTWLYLCAYGVLALLLGLSLRLLVFEEPPTPIKNDLAGRIAKA